MSKVISDMWTTALLVCFVTSAVQTQSGDFYDYLPVQSDSQAGSGSGIILSIVGVFEFFATTEWQTMTSQGFPSHYPNDASFAWQVEAENQDEVILLQLSTLHLGSGDVLVIYDGSSFMSKSVRTFEGVFSQSQSTDFVLSTSDRLYITMESDASGTAQGFSFNIHTLQKDENPLLQLQAIPDIQVLTSPALLDDISSLKVTYIIYTDGMNNRILLILNHVHLSSGDSLTVQDGLSLSDVPLRNFTGSTHLHHSTDFVISSSTRLHITAEISATEGKKSYSLLYYTVSEDEAPVFKLVAMEEVMSLTSPKYPLYYPRDMAAFWLIQSPGFSDRILLQLRTIELVRGDILHMYDGGSSHDRVLKEITGPYSIQESTEIWVSTSNIVLVQSEAVSVRGGGAYHLDYRLMLKDVPAVISVLLSNKSVTLTSPNYQEVVPSSVGLIWEIETSSINDTVLLEIEELYLDSGDKLMIYENKSEHSQLDVHHSDGSYHRQFSGQMALVNTTDFVRSYDNNLSLAFVTVLEGSKRFKMELSLLPQWQQPVFELLASSNERHLTSPNYPHPYLPQGKVTWTITAERPDTTILLKLYDLHIPSGDLVHIYNSFPGDSNYYLLRSISGPDDHEISSDLLLSFSASLTVVLESHSVDSGPSFDLSYDTVEDSIPVIALQGDESLQSLVMPQYDQSVQQTIQIAWEIKATDPEHLVVLMLPYNELHTSDRINIYENSLVRSFNGLDTQSIAMPSAGDLIVAHEFNIQALLKAAQPHQKKFYYYTVKDRVRPQFSVAALTDVQELTSPNFPNKYPVELQQASWLIKTKHSSQQVLLHLAEVHLADGDTVTIFDGFDSKKEVLKEISGPVSYSALQEYLRTTQPEMFITFLVTSETAQKGYRFLFHTVGREEFFNQDLTATASVQVLNSPGYPNTYQRNTKSSWTFTAGQLDHIVVLHFPHVHLISGDYIYVYDGAEAQSSKLLLSLTGHSHTKSPAESSAQHMHVQFLSQQDSPTDEGFQIIYYTANLPNQSVDLDPCLLNPCPLTHVCERLIDTYACICPPQFVGDQCTFRCDHSPADVAFLLDSSRSISEEHWAKVVEFVTSLVQTLQVNTDVQRIGVISFAANATIDIYFDDFINYTAGILNVIQQLPYKDSMTNIAGAIRLMKNQLFKLERGDREFVKNIAVLITDGEATIEREMARTEANRAKYDHNILTFAVAIGDHVKETELLDIVSRPVAQYLFRVESFDALHTVTRDILSATCSEDLSVLKGELGSDGPVGLRGDAGHTGDVGIPGVAGHTGQPGQQGERGSSVQGSPGQPGATGHAGTLGYPGPTGLQGETGTTGTTGRKGRIGEPGVCVEGATGTMGGTGPTGESGIAGSTGSVGEQGVLGEEGISGMVGPTGGAGNTGRPGGRGLPGQKGPDGDAGPAGPPGQAPDLQEYMDENQCASNQTLCDGRCVDMFNGYRCECPKGYTLGEDGSTCNDANECLVANGGCEQICKNTEGSHQCYCGRGFTLSLDTVTCLDVDECCSGTIIPVCQNSEICVNMFGGYACLSKRIAFFPSKQRVQPKSSDDFLNNRFGDMLMSRNFFIGLIVWLTVLTLIAAILYCVLWTGNPEDVMEALRGRIMFEENLQHDKQERFRRMTSQERESEYVFPRLSLRGDVEPDYTDSGRMRGLNPMQQPPTRKSSLLTKNLARAESLYLDPYRRRSLVTIESPGGHMTRVKDPR